MYFKEAAQKETNRYWGLEMLQRQVKTIFEQMTIHRQLERLSELFKEKDG